MQDENVR